MGYFGGEGDHPIRRHHLTLTLMISAAAQQGVRPASQMRLQDVSFHRENPSSDGFWRSIITTLCKDLLSSWCISLGMLSIGDLTFFHYSLAQQWTGHGRRYI